MALAIPALVLATAGGKGLPSEGVRPRGGESPAAAWKGELPMSNVRRTVTKGKAPKAPRTTRATAVRELRGIADRLSAAGDDAAASALLATTCVIESLPKKPRTTREWADLALSSPAQVWEWIGREWPRLLRSPLAPEHRAGLERKFDRLWAVCNDLEEPVRLRAYVVDSILEHAKTARDADVLRSNLGLALAERNLGLALLMDTERGSALVDVIFKACANRGGRGRRSPVRKFEAINEFLAHLKLPHVEDPESLRKSRRGLRDVDEKGRA